MHNVHICLNNIYVNLNFLICFERPIHQICELSTCHKDDELLTHFLLQE